MDEALVKRGDFDDQGLLPSAFNLTEIMKLMRQVLPVWTCVGRYVVDGDELMLESLMIDL